MTGTGDIAAGRARVNKQLQRFRRWLRLYLVFDGGVRWLLCLLLFGAVSLVVDRWLGLSLQSRMVLLSCGCLGLALLAWRQLIGPWLMPLRQTELLSLLERRQAGLGEQLARVLEAPPADALAVAAVARRLAQLQDLRLRRWLNHRTFAANVVVLLLVAAGAAHWLQLDFSGVSLWWQRWFLASQESWPQQTYLEVVGRLDDVVTCPLGEPCALQVFARDGSVVPAAVTIDWTTAADEHGQAALTRVGENDFRFTFAAVRQPISFQLRGGDDILGPLHLLPVTRPRVISVQAQLPQPDGSLRSFDLTAGEPLPRLLPGTPVTLAFETDVAVSAAAVSTAAGEQLEVAEMQARHFAAGLELHQSTALAIVVTGVGGLTSDAVSINLEVAQDLPPEVSLRAVGVRRRVSPTAQIPVTAEVRDDFGVLAVLLSAAIYAAADGRSLEASLIGRDVGARVIEREHVLEVQKLTPPVGAQLSLLLTAADNRRGDSQISSAPQLVFTIVAAPELEAEIMQTFQTRRLELQQVVSGLETLRRRLPQTSLPDMLRLAQTLQRDLVRIRDEVRASLLELELNAVGTPAVRQLLRDQILTGLDRLTKEEGPNLSIALRAEDRDGAAEAAASVLARLRDLLAQMSQWSTFAEALSQLEEIIHWQESAIEATDAARRAAVESVFSD